jgi:hypothetical protein
LLVPFAEVDNSIEINGVGMLEDDLETSLVVLSLLSLFSQSDYKLQLAGGQGMMESQNTRLALPLSGQSLKGVYMFLLHWSSTHYRAEIVITHTMSYAPAFKACPTSPVCSAHNCFQTAPGGFWVSSG